MKISSSYKNLTDKKLSISHVEHYVYFIKNIHNVSKILD